MRAQKGRGRERRRRRGVADGPQELQSVTDDKLSVKSLAIALNRLSTSQPNQWFVGPKPREKLAMAVLNEIPGGAPVAVFAHSNWEGSPHLAHAVHPFTGKIALIEGMDIPRGNGHSDFRCDAISASFLF